MMNSVPEIVFGALALMTATQVALMYLYLRACKTISELGDKA